jgi:nucleoside phosphorylase
VSLPAPVFGILTALPEEFHAMRTMVDDPQLGYVDGDQADYVHGTVPSRDPERPHQVVVTLTGDTASHPAAHDAANLARSFTSVQCVIMTGIAASVPNLAKPDEHVRLGDIVVADWGVISYGHIVVTGGTSELRQVFPPPWARLLRANRLLSANGLAGERPWEQWLEANQRGPLADHRRPPARTDVLRDREGRQRRSGWSSARWRAAARGLRPAEPTGARWGLRPGAVPVCGGGQAVQRVAVGCWPVRTRWDRVVMKEAPGW